MMKNYVSAVVSPEQPGKIFIAWKRQCFRSFQTANLFGAKLVYIWPHSPAFIRSTILRYLYSVTMTVAVLARERPTCVIVLNQPPPLLWLAYAYCRLRGVPLILDSHSRPFGSHVNSILRAIYISISRFSRLNVTHNLNDQAIVDSWGAHAETLEALPLVSPYEVEHGAIDIEPYIFCVCSFSNDEPISLLMEATALIPQVKFFISGKVPRDVLTLKSTPNTVFLGYLPSSEYYTYLANARLVLTLSTRSWIMQMAVEEALLYGVPVVTNHSPVIESVASCGGKFVSLSAPEVARGINEALEQHDDLLLGIRADRARLLSAMADKYKNFDF